MFAEALIVALLVLVISFLIAQRSRQSDPHRDLEGYLFDGNSHGLAITSNIGSLLSVALIFSLYIVLMVGGGLLMVLPVLAGIIVAYVVLGFALRSAIRRSAKDPARYTNSSFASLFSDCLPQGFLTGHFVLQYGLFIIIEFAVLAQIIDRIFEAPVKTKAIVLIIAFLCATYSVVGGFSGVLRTDLFQVGVVSISLLVICFKYSPQIWSVCADSLVPARIGIVRPLTWVTVMLFTFAWFSSWPDVWIRNMGTLEGSVRQRTLAICGTALGIIIFLIPLTILALVPLTELSEPTGKFEVDRAITFFGGMFRRLASDPLQGAVTWLVTSSFICIFITTIDSWLIGVVHHVCMRLRQRKVESVRLLPYALAIGGAIIGISVPAKGILAIGLFAFPCLFLNTLFLISEAWLRWRIAIPGKSYMLALASGLLVTLVCVVVFWEDLEGKGQHTIFASAVAVYGVWAVINIRAIATRRVVKMEKEG